jgi:ubiquinone/menaquinone biosynthesis C-methylase UbiE
MESMRWLCPDCAHELGQIEYGVPPPPCQGCGRKFETNSGVINLLNNSMNHSARELQKTYDELAQAAPNPSKAVGRSSSAYHAATKQVINALLVHEKGSIILDLGCGHGEISSSLLGQNRVLGLDISVRQLLNAQKNGLEVYQANANSIPLADNQIDVVLFIGLLQYFEDIQAVMKDICRVLKPGGRLVVETLNARSLLRRISRNLTGNKFPYLYSIEKVLAAAESAGLKSDAVGWTYFPTAYYNMRSSRGMLKQQAASNFAVRFVKN